MDDVGEDIENNLVNVLMRLFLFEIRGEWWGFGSVEYFVFFIVFEGKIIKEWKVFKYEKLLIIGKIFD